MVRILDGKEVKIDFYGIPNHSRIDLTNNLSHLGGGTAITFIHLKFSMGMLIFQYVKFTRLQA
jgi:hypothetical protein